jgi:NitT/TauT family transport system substrate-binding protein
VVQRSGSSLTEQDGLSRRGFLGRAGGLGATALFGSVLVACGDSDGGAAAQSDGGSKLDKVKITLPSDVTLVLWSVDYLSEDLGYYKDEGITVERMPFGGGPLAMQGLLSGAGAGTLQTPGEFLGALAKNQKLKALMSHTNAIGARMVVSERFAQRLGVTPDDSIEAKIAAIGSVKGARYAISAPGSQTDGLTRMMLKQSGLDPDGDARIIPLQTGANYLPALANDRIDGFVSGDSPVPELAILEHKAVPLLSVPDGEIRGAERLAGQTLVARASDIEANPERFAKLVRANVRALQTLLDDPEKARDLLRKTRFGDVDRKIWELMWRNNLPTWRSPYVATESLAAWVENGLIPGTSDPGELPLDDAIEPRFVEDAVKSIGWDAPTV